MTDDLHFSGFKPANAQTASACVAARSNRPRPGTFGVVMEVLFAVYSDADAGLFYVGPGLQSAFDYARKLNKTRAKLRLPDARVKYILL